MTMRQSDGIQSSLPDDIALKIASYLEVWDLCALGSCSRFWRDLCESDCLWASLCKDRWPVLDLTEEADDDDDSVIKIYELDQQTSSNFQGWKSFYIYKHKQMASGVAMVVEKFEQCSSFESIEAMHYLTAIEELCSMQFGFKDVQMFLFKPQLNVLLNLIGVHYSVSWLGVPAELITDALESCKISDRQVSVRWWKLGRWFYGFRMRDESHFRKFSLGDLAMAKEEEVLGVLHRGAIHEVLRVQISVAKPACTPWSSQTTSA